MIPEEMKAYAQWVCWKYIGRGDIRNIKMPVTPCTGNMAKVDDPLSWGTYEEAMEHVCQYDGIGFVLSEWDELVVIHIPSGVNPAGELSSFAQFMVEQSKSYAEIAGIGVSLIVTGSIQREIRNENIEVYPAKRFWPMTGRSIGAPVLADGQEILDEIQAGRLTDKENEVDKRLLVQLYRLGGYVRLLYDGYNARYGSREADDRELCRLINTLNHNDIEQTNRIFRKSGRMRPLWDTDYGRKILISSQVREGVFHDYQTNRSKEN